MIYRIALTASLCTIILVILIFNIIRPTSNYKNTAIVGQKIPSFQLETENNEIFTEIELIGKLSILHIWATWCATCYKEHVNLTKNIYLKNFALYGISYKDNDTDVGRWLNLYGNPYIKNGLDKSGKVSIDFGVRGTPEWYVINTKGIIMLKHEGEYTNAFEAQLSEIIKRYK